MEGPITSCAQLIEKVSGEVLLSDIITHVLPDMCELIRYEVQILNASDTDKNDFYDLCCSPIPSSTSNTSYTNRSGDDEVIRKFCQSASSKMLNYYEKELFQEICGVEKQPLKFKLISYLFLSLFAPLGLFTNILILMTVYKIKRLRNTTGYFICNLAVADIFVIIQMIVFEILYWTRGMEKFSPQVNRYLVPSFDIFIGSASLLHITAVSIERGVAVSMPLSYPRYLSDSRSKRVIKGIWLYCIFLFILSIIRIWIEAKYKTYHDVFFYSAVTCSFFIPCVLVLTSYGFILVSALKNMRMEQKISKVIVVISMMDNQNLEQVASVGPARFREIKIAFNIAVMTIPFVCGWGFFMICQIYENATGYQFTGEMNWFITRLPFIVSCINPLTYIMFTRSLRKNSLNVLVKSVLCRNLRKTFMRRESLATSISANSERQLPQVPATTAERNGLMSTEPV